MLTSDDNTVETIASTFLVWAEDLILFLIDPLNSDDV
jgi:GTP1/Obg family GTP-binding protein